MTAIDPYELPAAANDISEDGVKEFTCIKCGDITQYTEFAEAPDAKHDYGYFVMETCIEPMGVRIVEGIDMCSLCVRTINVGK